MEPGRLEYGFGLHTSHLTNKVGQAGINPFTKQPEEFPIDDPLTPEECEGIRRVFAEDRMEEDIADDAHVWRPTELDSVRFRSSLIRNHPVKSLAVEIIGRPVTDEMLALVLRVARQGNLVFKGSYGQAPVCLTGETKDPIVRQRWPDAGLIETVQQLRAWLDTWVPHRTVYRTVH